LRKNSCAEAQEKEGKRRVKSKMVVKKEERYTSITLTIVNKEIRIQRRGERRKTMKNS